MNKVLRLGAIMLLGTAGWAQSAAPASAQSTFQQLKTLQGEWQVDFGEKNAPQVTVRFDVFANGSVLRETSFPGTSNEMITLFHLDGDTVVSTHYCAGGNQSTVRAPAHSTKEIVFPQAAVTNLAPGGSYMRLERVEFVTPDTVRFIWSSMDAKGTRLNTTNMTYHRKK